MQVQKLRRWLCAAISCVVMVSGMGLEGILTAEAASNQISNAAFDSGTSGWDVYACDGGAGTVSASSGQLALNVTATGSVGYAVQLFAYDEISLVQGVPYRLQYDISSTVSRDIEVIIQQNGGTYQSYSWQKLSLSTEAQHVDYTFTMPASDDSAARLVFNCGNQSGSPGSHTIYLDNVSLECADSSQGTGSGSGSVNEGDPTIVLNQVGFLTGQEKTAVFRGVTDETQFSVVDAQSGSVVYTAQLSDSSYNSSADETDYTGDFSGLTQEGTYYITCGDMEPSYSFTVSDNVYDTVTDDTVRMLYLQRCGCQVIDDTFGHTACHTSQAKLYGTTQYMDVSGGWHDAGDYGRYVTPAAKTVADLLYAYAANPGLYGDSIGIPESGNGIPDILDEVRYELEWMLKMQNSVSGGVYHKVTCADFPGFVMPENETAELIVTPISSLATADFSAAMAMAYEFYLDIDADFAETCLSAARKAYQFLKINTGLIFYNPTDISTGTYEDSSDTDERYWAAAQMYRATGEETFLDDFRNFSLQTGMDWATVGDYGNIAYLTMDDVNTSDSLYTSILDSVCTRTDYYVSAAENSPYGSPIYEYYWGSNMTIANAGVMMGLCYKLTGETQYLTGAQRVVSHLLGANPNAVSYVTGYGTVSPEHPHHRPSVAKDQSMPGMLVGGVNQNLEDPAAKSYLSDAPKAKCYIDDKESYSTNEVTIYWNSPLIYLFALTQETASAGGGNSGTITTTPVQGTDSVTTTTTTITTTTATAAEDVELTDLEKKVDSGTDSSYAYIEFQPAGADSATLVYQVLTSDYYTSGSFGTWNGTWLQYDFTDISVPSGGEVTVTYDIPEDVGTSVKASIYWPGADGVEFVKVILHYDGAAETTVTTTTTTTTTATTATTTTATTGTEVSETYLEGDINLDTTLGLRDIVLYQKYLFHNTQLTEAQYIAADISDDGRVNIFDLAMVKQAILRL
ncbi:MAG: glycoside hydrolase family 9 protein [Ruminococcus sp.]|nr:glycoside hydrolase family 9 protein [Ruminococcus sp.]